MSTSQCTTSRTSAAADVTRSGALFDKLYDDGALDYLRTTRPTMPFVNLEPLLARAEHALGGSHLQTVALQA